MTIIGSLFWGVGLTGKSRIDPASNTRPSESHQSYLCNSLYNTVFHEQLFRLRFRVRGVASVGLGLRDTCAKGYLTAPGDFPKSVNDWDNRVIRLVEAILAKSL